MSDLKSQVVNYTKHLGFDLVRIADASPLEDAGTRLAKQLEAGFHSPLTKHSPKERTTPTLLLPGAKSVIMVGMAYSVELDHAPDRIPGDQTPRGLLSRYAWGQDYHRIMGPRLRELAAYLNVLAPDTTSRVMVDSGPLAEKAMAYRAGLGVYGWNSCIITRKWGSWVFLGAIVTDLALEHDSFHGGTCQECGRCIKACPTGAIVAPYVIDASRCLSQITQTRGIMPTEFRQALGTRLFGCDTCQAVCPHNEPNTIIYGNHGEFRPHPFIGPTPPLEMVVTMDNPTFKSTFAQTAAGWRGRKVLQRNAVINLGNTGQPTAIPLLVKALRDPTEPVQTAAIWALGEIGMANNENVKRETQKILLDAKTRITSGSLHQEILFSLDRINN
ncbi:MAG: tRNA epoxyqueuosine(34) reductase QueG [Firmicutes bacterium]|nr:tRNA epoxyqueuosine(34) reductase QueG [Bacillota bacterium]